MSATESSIMCVVNLILTERSGLSRVYVQKVGNVDGVPCPVDSRVRGKDGEARGE